MKRVKIFDLNSNLIASADMQDTNQWISSGISGNWWGFAEREKSEVECSPEDIASALSSRVDDLYGITYYTLPAQYTVQITDVSSDYQKSQNDAWVAARNAQCESDIAVLLAGREKETILSFALSDIYVTLNWSGLFTPTQIAAAKSDADSKFALFSQIQTLMNTRDAEIAAYLSAHPV